MPIAALQPLLRACRSAIAIVLDERCPVCQQTSVGAMLCPQCWLTLPYTHLRARAANPLERLFWGDHRVERVSAFLWYKPEYAVARLVQAFKYGGRRDLAIALGKAMARDLMSTDFFTTIDALVPVPLSRQRLAQRGYNQSHCLAQGVEAETGIPLLEGTMVRSVDNPSQTRLDPTQRRANVRDIFTIAQPDALHGRHILLIDDVITVGATLESLLHTLQPIDNLRVSILTLCAAGAYHVGRVNEADLQLPDHTAQLNLEEVRRYRPSSSPQ